MRSFVSITVAMVEYRETVGRENMGAANVERYVRRTNDGDHSGRRRLNV